MDDYPQPRPILYGTLDDEKPPPTQTAPVLTGPPRYPPAPPLAGDAPEPFDRPRKHKTILTVSEGSNRLLALAYAVASAYSLLQVALGNTGFADPLWGRLILVAEVIASLAVIAGLLWLGGREYLMAIGFVILHVAIGIVFGQWQSPALWVAIAVLIFLIQPPIFRKYSRWAIMEIGYDIARYRRRHPRRDRSW